MTASTYKISLLNNCMISSSGTCAPTYSALTVYPSCSAISSDISSGAISTYTTSNSYIGTYIATWTETSSDGYYVTLSLTINIQTKCWASFLTLSPANYTNSTPNEYYYAITTAGTSSTMFTSAWTQAYSSECPVIVMFVETNTGGAIDATVFAYS